METREDSLRETPPLFPFSIVLTSQPSSYNFHDLILYWENIKHNEETLLVIHCKTHKLGFGVLTFLLVILGKKKVLFNLNLVLSNSISPISHFSYDFFFHLKIKFNWHMINWTLKEYSLTFWPVKYLP